MVALRVTPKTMSSSLGVVAFLLFLLLVTSFEKIPMECLLLALAVRSLCCARITINLVNVLVVIIRHTSCPWAIPYAIAFHMLLACYKQYWLSQETSLKPWEKLSWRKPWKKSVPLIVQSLYSSSWLNVCVSYAEMLLYAPACIIVILVQHFEYPSLIATSPPWARILANG